jgi:hypothetical protein
MMRVVQMIAGFGLAGAALRRRWAGRLASHRSQPGRLLTQPSPTLLRLGRVGRGAACLTIAAALAGATPASALVTTVSLSGLQTRAQAFAQMGVPGTGAQGDLIVSQALADQAPATGTGFAVYNTATSAFFLGAQAISADPATAFGFGEAVLDVSTQNSGTEAVDLFLDLVFQTLTGQFAGVGAGGFSIGYADGGAPAFDYVCGAGGCADGGVASTFLGRLDAGQTYATRLRFNALATAFGTGRSSVTLEGGVLAFRGARPGPVPEPGTWALMIVGFGLAGAVLRRRGANSLEAS